MGPGSSTFVGRTFRALSFLVSSLGASALVLFLAARALAFSGVQRNPMALDVVARVEAARSRMRAEQSPERILLIGDSVLNETVPVPIHVAMEEELGRIIGTDA